MERFPFMIRHVAPDGFNFTWNHNTRTPEGIAKHLRAHCEPGWTRVVIVTRAVFSALGGVVENGQTKIGAVPVEVK
jgi:hypothetical protein